MKTPPFLVAAALLFWGWQTGFLIPAAVMAAVLEAARRVKARWELSDDDFARIWAFCAVLCLAAALYAFSANEGPGDFKGFFQNPNPYTSRSAGTATARTAAALFRWLPMIFCLFFAAQEFSPRQGIPLETISLILRRRWKKARKLGQPTPPSRSVDVSYPYVLMCLFASSFHASEDSVFFWGSCALLGWGLWPLRSRRFSLAVWAAAVVAAIGLGYVGQRGVGQLQNYLNNLNPEWFSGFGRRRFDPAQTRTFLGRIGSLKASGKIVIRLETRNNAPPPLLRETSYHDYRAQSWNADLSTNDFERILSETNETTYILLRDKTNSATVNLACYLESGQGLLPLPTGSGRLENLMAYDLQKNGLGAVFVPQGPGLVMFDALYGPGATMDSPPVEKRDLHVARSEKPAIDQVITDLGLAGQSREQALRTLHGFFQEKFAYSIWQGPARLARTNETALGRFLLRTRRGHCEYFATAGVLLLRELGIPARYAVGWAVHEGSGGKFVVRQRDAHAWCLVWDWDAGLWRDVDFTPSSWIQAEVNRASPFQGLWDLWSRAWFEFSKFRWGQTHLRQYILWGLLPILALLLYQIFFRRRHRNKQSETQSGPGPDWPGVDSEFYLLERKLAERGFGRLPSEPLADWLKRALGDPALAGSEPLLRELLRLHYRYRFDPLGLELGERERMRRDVRAWLARSERGSGM